MHADDFIFAVSNIRANEFRQLTKNDIDMFLKMENVDDIVRSLIEHGWSADESNKEIEINAENLLRNKTQKVWNYILGLTKTPEIFNFLLYKNDFHNLKVIIKSLFTEIKYDNTFLFPNTIDVEIIKKCAMNGDFDELPEFIRNSASEAYEILAKTNDARLFDIVLDKASLLAMAFEGKRTKNNFINGLCQKIIACTNLKMALRAAKTTDNAQFIQDILCPCDYFDINELASAVLSGNTEKFLSETILAGCVGYLKFSLSSFEKWTEDFIYQHLDGTKYMINGIEPLISYLYTGENEVKTLRIIITGKQNNISQEIITERLRSVYV